MNGYNFTERVRKVLMDSRSAAFALDHEYVGTEHILLGLLEEDGGVAWEALTQLGIDDERIRERLLETLRPGPAAPAAITPAELRKRLTSAQDRSAAISGRKFDLPYTSRAKKVLELAMSEARRLKHSYVGTEHLLLGLLAEEKGMAAQVLLALGMTTERTRETVLQLLGTETPRETRHDDRPATVTVVVEHGDGRLEAAKFRSSHDALRFLSEMEL